MCKWEKKEPHELAVELAYPRHPPVSPLTSQTGARKVSLSDFSQTV